MEIQDKHAGQAETKVRIWVFCSCDCFISAVVHACLGRSERS